MNTPRPGRFFPFSVTTVMAILLSGCASQLQVVTVPPGAQVTIRSAKGKSVATGAAPLSASVSFSGSNPNYSVEVTPPAGQEDRYLGITTNISQTGFQSLTEFNGKDHRRLDVRLDEKLFTVVPYVEVILDARKTWRGAVIRTRAYKDISEVGGSTPTQIADFGDNAGIQSLALSPDGSRMVYSAAKYSQSQTDLQKIFSAAEPRPIDVQGANLNAVNIGAGGIEHITSENFRDMFPTFTADGQFLLFASNRRRSDSEDILRISALRRSGVSDIYIHRDARLMRPTEAKDGTIAFAMEVPNPIDTRQRFTIWTLGGPNQFPTQIQTGNQPAISPDGKRIAYIGADGNLWVVNADGSQATQLTTDADKILERYSASLSAEEATRYQAFVKEFGFPEKKPFLFPSWSADGKKIVYTGMEGSDSTGRPNEDIWVMDFDGSNKKQLTTNGSIDRFPLLSPDGKWLYFMSNRGGRWAIWRIPGPTR